MFMIKCYIAATEKRMDSEEVRSTRETATQTKAAITLQSSTCPVFA